MAEEFLGEWLNDVHVTHFEESEIIFHSYASFTKDNIPRLEAFENVFGEINNSFFCIRFSRSDADFNSFYKHIDFNVTYDVKEFEP